MKTRVISGLIMLPLLVLLYFGGYPLMVACFLVSLVGTNELFSGFKHYGINPSYFVSTAMLIFLYLIGIFAPDNFTLIGVWMFTSLVFSSVYLFNIEKRKVEDGLATILGIMYTIFLPYHIMLIDTTGKYSILVWTVFIAAFGSDIFAYFTGYFLGKHKMSPKLSPKKTMEGLIGGILGSFVCCMIFSLIFCRGLIIHCMIIGVLGAIISVMGDLSASAYKRHMGIKDYGKLIPGHGGIMDRFDSVMFTGPLVYYYIALILAR